MLEELFKQYPFLVWMKRLILQHAETQAAWLILAGSKERSMISTLQEGNIKTKRIHPEDKGIVFNNVVIFLRSHKKSTRAFSSELGFHIAEVSLSGEKTLSKSNHQFHPTRPELSVST